MENDYFNGKKRGPRTTKKQIEIIINFLEENPVLLAAKLSPSDQNTVLRKWKELSHILNNTGHGPSKTIVQWRKSVSELKSNTRKRAREVFNYKSSNGAGPSYIKDLNDNEERLLGLLSKASMEAGDNPEAGLLKIEEHSAPETAEQNAGIIVFDFDECATDMEESPSGPDEMQTSQTIEESFKKPNKKRLRTEIRQKLETIIEKQTQCTDSLAHSVNNLAEAIKILAAAIEKKTPQVKNEEEDGII